jgi:hypothetical protein
VDLVEELIGERSQVSRKVCSLNYLNEKEKADRHKIFDGPACADLRHLLFRDRSVSFDTSAP